MPMSARAESSAPSSPRELDEAIAVLREQAPRFARTAACDKANMLRACLTRIVDAAPAWVAAGCNAKGLSPHEAGEEWLAGPMPTVRLARLLAESLDKIAAKGRPSLGLGSRIDDDGRLRIDLFPVNNFDRIFFAGFSGYALMEPGITREGARRKQASFYQQRSPEGNVSLILGAGNVSSIPPMDVFTKMFIDGSVCLLKMNPVNEWSGPILERCLAPLIAPGYLRIVYGGAEEGKYLVEHEGVDDVHITGSDHTHDAIVWGPPGPERDRRMAENEPLLQKPITSELGNVSPVAVVPYEYSDKELSFQARNLVSMVVNNASFNCNAAKMLITSRKWSQRQKFLDLVTRGLAEVPSRRAYYPGAFERYRKLVGGREGVRTFGEASAEKLPWALIHDVDAERRDEPLFRVEPFCGILGETCVGTADPVEFIERATRFMNERLWGTLNAAIVIHPKLESDHTVSKILDRAIAELRYGTVAINHWPALGYAMGTMPWGGHQSANLKDIQSGLGWVHNPFMLEGIDKAVVRGPLLVRPKPVWFYDNTRARAVGERLIQLEAGPTWRRVPGLLRAALL